ncbi:MAG: S8 family serine peptidase [Bdellovibrionota bacterium]
MKKILSNLLVLSAVLATQAQAAEFVLKHRGSIPAALQAQTFAANSGVKIMDSSSEGQLLKINIPDNTLVATMAKLLKDKNVEYIVPNFKLHRLGGAEAFDVGAFQEQWAITKVHAQEAWALAGNKGSRNVLVAVIDTGMDYNHPALKANAVQGIDYRDNDNDPMDLTGAQNPGHGTHCSGIIGADGSGGMFGISPEVSIMPIRFLGADGSGDLMNGIKAIDYAISKGVKVISASWGAAVSATDAQPLIEAVKRASDAGVIFVAAAANDGNSNDTTSMYPANAKFANSITVAASDVNDAKPSWSNYGKHKVDLASPGHEILSTLPGGKYGNLSGTSMATPLVSGLVAFLLAQDSTLSGEDVRSILQASGAKVSIETACNCRVDALAATETIVKKKLTVVPAAASITPDATLQLKGLYAQGPVTFKSSNNDIATISEAGVLTPKKEGDVTVEVTDGQGNKASSLAIYIGQQAPDNGGGGGGGGACPLPDPKMCDILCGIMPDAPFCKH